MIWFFWSGWSSLIEWVTFSLYKWWTPDFNEIITLLENYTSDFSIVWEILSSTLDNIISTFSSVFVLIFTYLFFLRLREEKNINTKVVEK